MAYAKDIEDALKNMHNDAQSKIFAKFFQTQKGGYGFGDKFLGIKNPDIRFVAKNAWKESSMEDATELIHSEYNEVRLCGLIILTEKMNRAVKTKNEDEMETIFHLYTSLHSYINNWNLVDLSAPTIAGFWELYHKKETLLDKWIQDKHSSMWQKRISMVSTWRLLRYNRYEKTIKRAEALINSKEDLLQKASGWMLREMGKNGGMEYLEDFLEKNVKMMPSVMIRYAIEKFPPEERKYWMDRRKKA